MSQRDLEMKSFGPFEIKSEDRGEVVAVVATLGVVDKDGDVILPGSVPPGGARVKLSSYDHDTVLKSEPPVGKGIISEEGDRLVFRGQFFMTTQRGREAFHTTKELGAEGEWSFGFPNKVGLKTSELTSEWRTKGARRIISAMRPVEASPVFEGAGWGTGTLSTKAAEDAPESLETPEEVEARILYGDPEAKEPQGIMTLSHAATVIDTPADEAARMAAERQAAEDAEAKATAEVAAQLKANRDEAMEEYHRVQRALRRMGYAA